MPPPPSSVSMLGKLFSIGAGAPAQDQDSQMGYASRAVPSLDSVQEDIHTRNLLFPDPQSLFLHRNDQVFPLSTTPTLPLASMSNAFDFIGELELDTRDVRVLIMQDTLGSFNASPLFDTHPCPVVPSAASSPGHDGRRVPTSPRKPSFGQSSRPVVIQPDNPHLRHGAFDRRPDIVPRQSSGETDPQRLAREHREEMSTFTSCVFGSSELMAYKGTSTKVHVVPTESRVPDYSTSTFADGRGSVGRASMRTSRLAQSYTSEIASPTYAPSSFTASQVAYRPVDRKKILITRLFPVTLPADDVNLGYNTQRQPSDEGALRSAQKLDSMASPKKPNVQVRQKRTPMYAVVLVIQLPASPAAAVRTPFRGSGSFTDQDSFPSSFNSARRSAWTAVGSGQDSVDSSPFDGDDPMDYVTQHWDIIMRTLTHLQSVAATSLGSLLKQADQGFTYTPYPPNSSHNSNRGPSFARRADDHHKAMKPSKSNAKIVALPPNSLSQDPIIQQRTHEARARIVTGLKAARVVTGQGRWGIWRDEARLAARNSGAHDHRFLLNLLTGFLATHTDWLQALSPSWCRKRYFQQQRPKGGADLALPTRTIIVSEDKMLARRFIFLLSAFLPAHQSIPAIHPHRPSTSTSIGPLSQSPPSIIVPIVREESLRRKMTRRTGPRRSSHSRTISQSTRTSVPTQLAHLSMDGHHERRSSDAASVRTMNLSIPYGEFANRKGMAATTTTTPDTTAPHFSNVHRTDSRRSTRPGSSSSMAADDLRRSLQRAESTGQGSSTIGAESRTQSSKWGSVISGLWSGHRRRDSTSTMGDGSRPPPSPMEPPSPTKRPTGKPNKLEDMVREPSLPGPSRREQVPGEEDPVTPRGLQQDQGYGPARPSSDQVRRWPEPGAPFETQIKTTINHEDGVIDVDVPFTDYLTDPRSLDTAVSSPSSSGYLSTPGLGTVMDSFEQACRLALEGDLPLNSAGWLQSFHPDFVLQAIPPQRDLVKEVKAALRAEPSPTPPPTTPTTPTDQPTNEWVDISTAIIADITSGRVRRIRYRRLLRVGPAERPNSHGSAGSHGTKDLVSSSTSPYEKALDEQFVEDEITTAEASIADAVERVITQVGDSKVASSSSSRSNSKHRAAETVVPPLGEADDTTPRTPFGVPEVPRSECRSVILTALADMITDVMEKKESGEESAVRVAVRSWLDQLERVEGG